MNRAEDNALGNRLPHLLVVLLALLFCFHLQHAYREAELEDKLSPPKREEDKEAWRERKEYFEREIRRKAGLELHEARFYERKKRDGIDSKR